MNKNKIKRSVVLFLLLLIASSIVVFAEGDAYVSADDPLVTVSYIDQVVRPQLATQIKEEILAELRAGGIPGGTSAEEGSSSYSVVYATSGQTVLADGGADRSTEIILRAGSAVSVSADPGQGLSDLTSSAELLGGAALTRNHYVIIPRGDGRGVRVMSSDAYFLVRGEYRIVD